MHIHVVIFSCFGPLCAVGVYKNMKKKYVKKLIACLRYSGFLMYQNVRVNSSKHQTYPNSAAQNVLGQMADCL